MLVASHSETIRTVLRESFRENEIDGYFYPSEPGVPLVRIQVAAGGYQIERRRNVDSAWMPMVTADTAEFDAHAFRVWRASWPVVA